MKKRLVIREVENGYIVHDESHPSSFDFGVTSRADSVTVYRTIAELAAALPELLKPEPKPTR